MSIIRQLARWKEAGLLDAATAERISAFEAGRKRPVLLYAVGGLGALAVAIGIISVIAANWDGIGRAPKVGADLALMIGVAFAIMRSRSGHWVRETLLLFYFLLFLGSIALIGQTYQQGGELYQALLLWLALGSPLVLFGRSWFLALVWLAGVVAAAAVAADSFHVEETVSVAGLSLGPLLFLGLGTMNVVRQRRPQYAGLFRVVGWLGLVGVTSLAQHAWYVHWSQNEASPWLALIPTVVGLFLAWWLPGAQGITGQGRWLWRGVLAFAAISSIIPISFSHGEYPVLGAISFILLWIGYALAAYQAGHIRLLNLCTAIIGVRLVIVYVEVFGSLLQTGLAMIIGGLLTLGLAWVWVRKSRDFRKAAQPEVMP